LRSLLRRFHCRIAVSEDDIRRLAHDLRNGRSHPIGVARAPVKIDLKISTKRPAGFLKLALKHPSTEFALRIVFGIHHE